MLLAVLLTAMSILGMAPAATVSVAAPDQTTDISPDQEEISVLSVEVNVNMATGTVSTDLVLHNNSSENKEVTFALPKISAGMDTDSLKVGSNRGKDPKDTDGGSDLETGDGVVTLHIKAGGDAGLSYSYKTGTNLNYASTILFDLRPLAEQFSDRIGHLEWTVDMPLYELVLVKEIHPVNYTVADNRISVVLDDFTVSNLLNRVYLVRTTHTGLLEEIDSLQEKFEMMPEQNDYTTLNVGFCEVARFIALHYREWYRDPKFADQVVSAGNKDVYIRQALTVFRQYLQEAYPDEDTEAIFAEILRAELEETTQENSFSTEDEPGQAENDLVPSEIKEKYDLFQHYLNHYKYVHYFPDFGGEREISVWQSSKALLYGLIRDEEIPIENIQAPAFCAQIYSCDPKVYAVLLAAQPDLEDKYVVSVRNSRDEPPGNVGSYADMYSGSDAVWLPEMSPMDDANWHQQERSLELQYQGYRIICLLESDLEDLETVRNYLDVMHVRAIERTEVLMRDSEKFRSLEDQYDLLSSNVPLFSYAGTEEYPFEQFEQALSSSEDICYGFQEILLDFCNKAFEENEFIEGFSEYRILSDFRSYLKENDPVPRTNESDPFLQWKGYYSDLNIPAGSVHVVKEDNPYQKEFSIPIITHYVGYAYPVEEEIQAIEEEVNTEQKELDEAAEKSYKYWYDFYKDEEEARETVKLNQKAEREIAERRKLLLNSIKERYAEMSAHNTGSEPNVYNVVAFTESASFFNEYVSIFDYCLTESPDETTKIRYPEGFGEHGDYEDPEGYEDPEESEKPEEPDTPADPGETDEILRQEDDLPDPKPQNEKDPANPHLPVIFIIAGFGGILAIIALRVVRKVKR